MANIEEQFSFEQFGIELKKVSESIQKIASELEDTSPTMHKHAGDSGNDDMGKLSTLPSNRGGNPLLDFILS